MKVAHKHGQFHGAGHVKKQRKKHRAAERMTRTSSPPLSEHFAVWNKGKIAAQKPRHRKQSLKHTVFLHFSNLDLAKDLSPDLLAELCGAALKLFRTTSIAGGSPYTQKQLAGIVPASCFCALSHEHPDCRREQVCSGAAQRRLPRSRDPAAGAGIRDGRKREHIRICRQRCARLGQKRD